MVDTLRELAQRYPGNGLVLLLGSDQFAALSTWHEPELVPQLARIAVARRPGVSPDVLADADVDRIEMPQVDISSSMIRERVAAGPPDPPSRARPRA